MIPYKLHKPLIYAAIVVVLSIGAYVIVNSVVVPFHKQAKLKIEECETLQHQAEIRADSLEIAIADTVQDIRKEATESEKKYTAETQRVKSQYSKVLKEHNEKINHVDSLPAGSLDSLFFGYLSKSNYTGR